MYSIVRKHMKSLCLLLSALFCFSGCGTAPAAESTEAATEPTIVLSPLELEVERVSGKVLDLQNENSFSFLAVADTHENEENKAANQLLGEAAAMVRNSVELDFTALLGGVVSDEQPAFEDETAAVEVVTGYLKDAFSGIPNFIALGEQDPFAVLPDATLAEPYHFQDLAEHQTRVIVLNTSDTTAETKIGMSARQLQWFAESLDLSSKADAQDWGILILSHMPLDFDILLEQAGPVLDAYLAGTAVELTLEEQTVSYTFENKNAAEIIANIHGHTHNFLIDTLYLLNQRNGMYRSPIVRLCVPNASATDNNPFGSNGATDSNGIEYGEEATYEKSSGAELGTAFNIITVDREEKILYCTNFGVGNHRRIPYGVAVYQPEAPAFPEGTYTNLVPTSTEFGRRNNNIFNGVGYRNHTYLVCNDISEEAWPYGHDAEYFTTGAIPFTVPSYLTPPTIYLWGVELDEAEHTKFFIYDSQKYRLVLQATGAEFKNYFTIEQLGEKYYKLTPIPEGKASVLFPATNGRAGKGSIAFSLKGRGENLIVTMNEPILPE